MSRMKCVARAGRGGRAGINRQGLRPAAPGGGDSGACGGRAPPPLRPAAQHARSGAGAPAPGEHRRNRRPPFRRIRVEPLEDRRDQRGIARVRRRNKRLVQSTSCKEHDSVKPGTRTPVGPPVFDRQQPIAPSSLASIVRSGAHGMAVLVPLSENRCRYQVATVTNVRIRTSQTSTDTFAAQTRIPLDKEFGRSTVYSTEFSRNP